MYYGKNIRVSCECHQLLSEHLRDGDRKMGKWVEAAIMDKLKAEGGVVRQEEQTQKTHGPRKKECS